MILMRNLRSLPARCAKTTCLFSSWTRKKPLGKTSLILPTISIASVGGVGCGLGALAGWDRFRAGRALTAVRMTLLCIFFQAEAQCLVLSPVAAPGKKHEAPLSPEQGRGMLRISGREGRERPLP